jgi:hypothetical protein
MDELIFLFQGIRKFSGGARTPLSLSRTLVEPRWDGSISIFQSGKCIRLLSEEVRLFKGWLVAVCPGSVLNTGNNSFRMCDRGISINGGIFIPDYEINVLYNWLSQL